VDSAGAATDGLRARLASLLATWTTVLEQLALVL
jgi:hypothetical protein